MPDNTAEPVPSARLKMTISGKKIILSSHRQSVIWDCLRYEDIMSIFQ